MTIDRTTLNDLGIFQINDQQGSNSVFQMLDRCVSFDGRAVLRQLILQPPDNFDDLKALQDGIKYFYQYPNHFTSTITNGTLVMVEKFFEETHAQHLPQSSLSLELNGLFQKIFNKQAYFLTSYSITHVADVVKGIHEMMQWEREVMPPILQERFHTMAALLQHPLMHELQQLDPKAPYKVMARLSYKTRRQLKNSIQQLVQFYATLDAWHSMAVAAQEHGWQFPELAPAQPSLLIAEGFYHPLLQHPVSYDMTLQAGKNFLMLTGANMSGKTTFLRSIGILALLAHIGSAVPATFCKISFLKSIITNMHVEDNILMGESYFLAEVKRIKSTAEQVARPQPQLILMDELFKGTNVHDAYECTRAVIEGLEKHPQHLMMLSTHLYEVAQHFSTSPVLKFAYFTTELHNDGSFKFTYQLQPGISNDRIGYRILKQEGVLQLLNESGK